MRADSNQGTWQFMSAGLISGKTQHDFRDDLESSIYVLLWTTLMYSVIPEESLVLSTLRGVLDPQPYENLGGVAKQDYLRGGAFLDKVQFPDWPKLHELMSRLRRLFAVHYEKVPTIEHKAAEETIRAAGLDELLKESYAAQYSLRTSQLENHDATIKLFEEALKDHSQWPCHDVAVLQKFNDSKPRPQPMTKTGWRTSQFQ